MEKNIRSVNTISIYAENTNNFFLTAKRSFHYFNNVRLLKIIFFHHLLYWLSRASIFQKEHITSITLKNKIVWHHNQK